MSPTSTCAVLVFGIRARRVGGIECHTRALTRRLLALGWQCVLCFPAPPLPEVRSFLSAPGVHFEELPWAAGNSWQSSRDLARVLRIYRPAVVHFQFTPFLGLHAWLARALGTGKIIFTDHHSHEEDAVLKRAPLWKRLAGRWLNSPVSVVATVSEFNRSVLREQGTCASSSIQVVYNGSDLSLPEAAHSSGAAFRRKFGIPMDRILVTQVSSMVPQKGIPDLLEAVRIALPSVPALHCALVGDGTKSAEYARLAAEMGIAGHITWTGLSLFPMADGVFAGSDIICQASRWHEAFGLGISEAMAWAKPVVATTVGGIPEVVEDGNTGILVPPRSPTALAAALVRLAIHPAFRQQLGEAGRKRAQLKFDVRSNVETLLKFYEVSGNP